MLSLAGVVAIVALLAGCTPTDPVVTPRPEPSATPLFASEDEALAAATEAYAAYTAVSDAILNEGGINPERLEAVATGDDLEINLAAFRQSASQGVHSVGQTQFDSVVLQRVLEQSDDGLEVVTLYLCEDVAGVDLLDSKGSSLVAPERPNRVPFEVSFSLQGGVLLVSRKDPWPGTC